MNAKGQKGKKFFALLLAFSMVVQQTGIASATVEDTVTETAQAEAQAKAEAEAKAQAEAQAKAEAEAKAQAEAQAKAESEAEAQAKAESEAEAQAGTETKNETQSDQTTEPAEETEKVTEPASDSETSSEGDKAAETEQISETEPETVPQTGTEAQTEPGTDGETETETEAETETETEAEMETETEAEMEAETETETEASKTEFRYEDSRVIITAHAGTEAQLPQDAELRADYLEPGTAEYNAAVAAIEAQLGAQLSDNPEKASYEYVLYDIYFLSAEENRRVEPEKGKVKVEMTFRTPVRSEAEASNENVEVVNREMVHVDSNGQAEVVTDYINTSDDGAVTSAVFSQSSFSPTGIILVTEDVVEESMAVYGAASDYVVGTTPGFHYTTVDVTQKDNSSTIVGDTITVKKSDSSFEIKVEFEIDDTVAAIPAGSKIVCDIPEGFHFDNMSDDQKNGTLPLGSYVIDSDSRTVTFTTNEDFSKKTQGRGGSYTIEGYFENTSTTSKEMKYTIGSRELTVKFDYQKRNLTSNKMAADPAVTVNADGHMVLHFKAIIGAPADNDADVTGIVLTDRFWYYQELIDKVENVQVSIAGTEQKNVSATWNGTDKTTIITTNDDAGFTLAPGQELVLTYDAVVLDTVWTDKKENHDFWNEIKAVKDKGTYATEKDACIETHKKWTSKTSNGVVDQDNDGNAIISWTAGANIPGTVQTNVYGGYVIDTISDNQQYNSDITVKYYRWNNGAQGEYVGEFTIPKPAEDAKTFRFDFKETNQSKEQITITQDMGSYYYEFTYTTKILSNGVGQTTNGFGLYMPEGIYGFASDTDISETVPETSTDRPAIEKAKVGEAVIDKASGTARVQWQIKVQADVNKGDYFKDYLTDSNHTFVEDVLDLQITQGGNDLSGYVNREIEANQQNMFLRFNTDSMPDVLAASEANPIVITYYTVMKLPGENGYNDETFKNVAEFHAPGRGTDIKSVEYHYFKPVVKNGHYSAPYMNYELKLNQGGERLNNGNPIEIRDVIGTGQVLIPSTIKFTPEVGSYRQEDTVDEQGKPNTTVYFTIPDSTSVTITYQAYVSGDPGDVVAATNTATITSVDVYAGSKTTSKEVHVIKATGSLKGTNQISILKKDADTKELLDGVAFTLYEVNESGATEGGIVYTTGTAGDGKLTFENLSYDKVYCFEETKPLAGYAKNTNKTYFYLRNVNEGKTSEAVQKVVEALNGKGIYPKGLPDQDFTYEVPNQKFGIELTKSFLEDGQAVEKIPNGTYTFGVFAVDKDGKPGENPLETKSVTVNDDTSGTAFKVKFTLESKGTYVVYELDSTGKKVENDSRITVSGKTFIVTGTGATVTLSDAQPVARLQIANTIVPDDAVLKLAGTKALINRTLTNQEFEFKITQDENDQPTAVITSSNAKKKNDANGDFQFADIRFGTAGTYTFTVEEDHKDTTDTENDSTVTYDSAVYRVTVEVEKDTENNKFILKTVTINDTEVRAAENGIYNLPKQKDAEQNDTASFVNTVKKGSLKITKTVTDNVDNDTEFTFTVTLGDGTDKNSFSYTHKTAAGVETTMSTTTGTITLKNGESAVIGNINYGTAYTVVETAAAGFVCSQTNGTITGTVNAAEMTAAFTNTKTAGLSITKNQVGGKSTDTFTFTVQTGGTRGDDGAVTGASAYAGKVQIAPVEEDEPSEITVTDGVITLRGGQTATIAGLVPSTPYIVTESTAAGYATTVGGTTTKEAAGVIAASGSAVTFVNTKNKKKLTFSKTEVNKTGELPGAKLKVAEIKDDGSAGEVVKEWTSGETAQQFDVEVGKTYTMTETTAPNGYEVAEDIVFQVTDDNKLEILQSDGSYAEASNSTVHMEDAVTSVKVSKVDVTGDEELEGAKIQILYKDKDGKEVVFKEWISGKTPEEVERLIPGVEYTLREEVAPEGYKVTTDTTFVLDEEGEIERTTASVKDGVLLVKDAKTSVKISKVDVTGDKELEGATIQILYKDKDGKEVVFKEWTSGKTPEEVEGLTTEVEYTLRETVAPEGYAITTDTTFTLNKEGEIAKTTAKVKDGVLLVEDAQVHVSKVDLGTGDELDGAHIQVLDKDNRVVDEWDSKKGVKHAIKNIKVGEEYTLRETVAPEGYAITTDTKFVLDKDGKVTGTVTTNKDGIVLVEDTRTSVKISKVDVTNDEELEGAKIQIIYKDKDGKEVVFKEWTSGKTPEEVEGLTTGVEYTLRETVAPEGYEITTDTTFVLDEKGEIDRTKTTTKVSEAGVLLVQDKKKPGPTSPNASIEVTKKLVLDSGAALGAIDQTFYVALYEDEACANRVSEVKPIVFKNASSSTVEFKNLEVGKTYYVGESDAQGNVILAGAVDSGEVFSANFAQGNKAVIEKDDSTIQINFENEFYEIPIGFYKQYWLTINKRLLGSDGSEKNSDETFYAGIFADPDYQTFSDLVYENVIALNLGGGSSASTEIEVTMPNGRDSVTLYVTETDANGVPVSNSGFAYKVSVDHPSVTFDESNLQASVTITNQEVEEAETETKTEKTTEKNTGKAVKTGDDTPILPWTVGFAVSVLVLAVLAVEAMRRKKHRA